jgi:tRNA modification GTPase
MTGPREKASFGKDEEPIAALASGAAAAAVALIRVSGKGALDLLERLLKPGGVAAWTERSLKLVRLVDPATGEVIDEPLCAMFKGPRSFTGQDSAEIHCHGGPYVIQRALQALFAVGFRQA